MQVAGVRPPQLSVFRNPIFLIKFLKLFMACVKHFFIFLAARG